MYVVGSTFKLRHFFLPSSYILGKIWNQGTYISPYKTEIKASYLC